MSPQPLSTAARYLATVTILSASLMLFCMLRIGTDEEIVGQVLVHGPPTTFGDVVLTGVIVSLLTFPVLAALYLFLHKRLSRRTGKTRLLLPLAYGMFWLYAATGAAGMYLETFGNTMSDFEFVTSYLLDHRSLTLVAGLLTLAYKLNSRVLRQPHPDSPVT